MKRNKDQKPQEPIENPEQISDVTENPDISETGISAGPETETVAEAATGVSETAQKAPADSDSASEQDDAQVQDDSPIQGDASVENTDSIDGTLEVIHPDDFPSDAQILPADGYDEQEEIAPAEEEWVPKEPQLMELGAHDVNSLLSADDPDAPAFQETSTRRSDAVLTAKGKKLTWKARPFLLILAAVSLVIIVLFVISLGRLNERLASPLTVGSQEVSNAEFSFMYHYVLLENGVDIFKANTEEMLAAPGENGFATYREYFLDITAKEIQTTYMLYDDALSNGYSISQEHKDRAQAYIDWLKVKADALHVDLDTYIKGTFGPYVNKDLILQVLSKVYFAEDYAAHQKLDELKATPEQAEQAYQDARNSYDLVSFRVLRITFEAREESYVTTANLHAQEIVDAIEHDQSKFESVASKYFSGEALQRLLVPDSTLHSRIRYSEVEVTEWRNWLFDTSRTSGDCVIFHDEYGFPIIFCFVDRVRQEEPLRNVRFFYINLENQEEGIPGIPAADILPLSQTIFDSITDEASMITLETTYADELLDGSMRAAQQTNIYPGNNSEEVDAWIFDPQRKSGDKIMFEGDTQIMIMFYVEASPNPEWYDRVNSFIRMDNYQAFVNAHQADYAYTFHEEGLKYIQDVPS